MQFWGTVWVVWSLALSSGNAAVQSEVAEDVRQSIEQLHGWLGDDSNAAAWRKYLGTDELMAQLETSPELDPTLLAHCLARFESGAQGLDRPAFVRVRQALSRAASHFGLTENQRLAAVARMAVGRFAPIDDQRLRSAKAELSLAITDLENYLNVAGAAEAQKWKSYLKWDQLLKQLASDSPDPDILNEVAGQYFQGQRGLEEPKFVRVREGLVAYRWLLLAKTSPDVIQAYDNQLASIADSILSLDDDPSVIKKTEISNRLEWLNDLGQAPQLVAGMHRRHDRPNVRIVVTEPLLARAMADRVDQVNPVSEMILDTHVRGHAHTVGDITANIVPSDRNALIEVYLNGVSTSDTIGYHPPVNIFSRGSTSVFGRARLLLDGATFGFEATVASCHTRTSIQSIRAIRNGLGKGLIEHIAWRRAAEQKLLSERIASRRAERRIASMMDQRVSERVAEANSRFDSKFRTPLLWRNAYPRWLSLLSTDDAIYITALQGRKSQFGASSAPPKMPPHGLQVQLHESMAANTAVNYLSGLTLTDEAAADVAKELTGEIPERLQLRQDEDPWSISFDRQNPVVLIFQNDEIQIVVRGRRFTRGDQSLNRLIEISARYQMVPTDGRMKLVRQGDVDIVYPERAGQRLSLTEITHRDFMRNKFGSVFKETIVSKGIKPPEQLRNVGTPQLRYAKAENGWLSLGWE
jgi:hypothetical protein